MVSKNSKGPVKSRCKISDFQGYLSRIRFEIPDLEEEFLKSLEERDARLSEQNEKRPGPNLEEELTKEGNIYRKDW